MQKSRCFIWMKWMFIISLPADSVVLEKNGKFSFTIDTKVPCFYQLRLSPDKIIVLFPKPGEHIKIDADAGNLLDFIKNRGITRYGTINQTYTDAQ